MMYLSCVALAVLPDPSDGWVDASTINVITSGEWPGSGSTHLIDGSGLSADLNLTADSTDTQNWLCHIDDGRWVDRFASPLIHDTSPSGVVYTDGWIAFTFSTPQTISQMWVWNYNNPNYLGRGWESVAVDYSADGTTWTRLGGGDTYLTFAQATGTNSYTCNNKIDFGGITVKKIVLSLKWATGNYGDTSHAGLSEILFKKSELTAASPNPENGSITNVNPILSWTPGALTVSHDVYLGTDQIAVQNSTPLLGDINGSGRVDFTDIGLLVEQWLQSPPLNSQYWADINDDAKVNFADFAKIAEEWLELSDGIYRGHYPLNHSNYDPGELEPGTTYYWRIDEVNGSSVWPGSLWNFTTIEGTNISNASLGAIAVPSSQSDSMSYEVENIIDDDANTFWLSALGTFSNWIEIRWPQPIYATTVVVDEKAGYLSASYRIDVFSVNTNSWQTIVGPKTNPIPGQTIIEAFSAIEITKVRFYALAPYNGATQSGITSMQVYGTRDWIAACKSELPPYKPDPASFPAVSSAANYKCTYFSATPTAVVPGSKVLINLKMRKATADTTNYGFQVRIGELASNAQYFDYTNYADYTVAVSEINPPTPTSQWVINRDYPLTISVYIPQWAPHANMPVIVTPLCAASRGTITNVANNIIGTFKIQRFATDPVPWPTAVPTTTIAIENDQANLYVNGNLVQPYIMTTPDYTTYQSMGEQLVATCKLWRLLTTKSVDASYGTPEGDAENAACFAELDQKINNLLKVDPNAYILPAFMIRASEAWSSRWPNDSTVLSNGERFPYSYSLSSARWASQLDYDYRALVAHLMTQNYSGHIIGVSYEMAKETQYWGCWENTSDTPRNSMVLGDYSSAHITEFRAWLQAKYVSEAALKTAWHDSNVTFATAYPTPSVLRQMDSTLMFKDPGVTRMPMDYWEFHAEAMAKMAIVAAKAIKEASGNKYITGLWGFYSNGVYATGTEPGKLVHMGHTALQTALASPYIDYFAILHSYAHRQWGEPTIAYQQGQSIRQHGKMVIVELDMRTFFTPIVFNDRTFSEPETLSVIYENIWGAALRGDALWWVGFSAGATGSDRKSIPWFASESVNEALVKSKKWYDGIRDTASPSSAEVAVFINNADIYAMDAFDGYKPQVSAQYQTVLYELTKLGTPVDYYELNDITKPCMSQYKVFVFLSAYNLTSAQRDAIKAVVRQTGKTAVWLYGAGYNNGTTNAVVNIQDLTGMITEVTLEKRLPVVSFLSGHSLTANIPVGYTLQPHQWEHDPRPYEIGPIFNVNDGSVEQLGTYSHNGKTAYAAKMVSNGRSIFMAIPYMSSVVLRDICRVSGVLLYSQNDLYLNADQHFILITNGSTNFSGSISLPQSSQVYDLWNKTIIGTGTSFNASIPANVSRMYFYGTSTEVTAFRAKVE